MSDEQRPHFSLQNYLLRVSFVGLAIAGVWFGIEHNAGWFSWFCAIGGVLGSLAFSKSNSEPSVWRLANVAVGTAVIGLMVLLAVVWYFVNQVLKSILP